MKVAIILFNLGGPDSPEAVEPFLRHLFSDPAIIALPAIFRLPLAWWIARRRDSDDRQLSAGFDNYEQARICLRDVEIARLKETRSNLGGPEPTLAKQSVIRTAANQPLHTAALLQSSRSPVRRFVLPRLCGFL